MAARVRSRAVPLLPGESRRSDRLDDAEHWTAVYEELTCFLQGRDTTDAAALRRFRSRLEYWSQRRDELAN